MSASVPLQVERSRTHSNSHRSVPLFAPARSAKLTTRSSKVKSPWNPTRLFVPSIAETLTAGVRLVFDESKVTFGNAYCGYRAGNLIRIRRIL